MPKIILTSRYLRDAPPAQLENYVRYVSTREGVEKVEGSRQNLPATVQQKDLVRQIVRDIPSAKEMLEYADFLLRPTMLGIRISDTLTLRQDCLFRTDGQDMIRIAQVKTSTFRKPVSAELAALIRKAAAYTKEWYGETEYIFVDERDISRPLQYTTIKHKVLGMIQKEDLRDDVGKPFGFSTHMFRRSYGARLTELHLDDWTIAKLLGHKGVSAVQHYRKMGNQMLADETRRAREEQTRILLASLDGWEEEYEQIR